MINIKRGLGKLHPGCKKNRKVILLYHSIGEHPWAVSRQQFNAQINWLHDHCSLHSLSELLRVPFSEKIQVALTFDDGYASLYDNALPILDSKKIKPQLYVNTGWISSHQRKIAHESAGHYAGEYFLTWAEVQQLYQAGWHIGSHAIHHYDFSKLGGDSMQKELSISKMEIESHLNTPCIHFSYPWGKYTPAAISAVKSAGFHAAVCTRHKKITPDFNLFALPRINISGNYSLNDFKDIIMGKWDFLNLIQKMKGF